MASGVPAATGGAVGLALAKSHALEAILPGGELFSRLLVGSTDPANILELGTDTVSRHLGDAVAFLAQKPATGAKIRIRSVDAHDGDHPRLSVVEILNSDMPFLVDSIIGEIHARGHQAQLVLHPIFKTRRSADGRLEAVTGPGDRDWSDGHQESYISIHLNRMAQDAADKLSLALKDLLSEVATVVADWRPMMARVEASIAALKANPPPNVAADLLAESIAFLTWLKDGQFTFLGMRELTLIGDAETGDLAPVEASGLGMLRDPSIQVLRRGRDLVAMTPEIRRFYFLPTPLIITKANVVARVHRRVHMDYVGVKIYDAAGALTGELRIVGLLTSNAYTQSVRDIPLLRRKVSRVLAGLGYPSQSHDGKATTNLLDTFPRDELFQISVDQLQSWTRAILDLELRPRVRVFARVDRFDRFVSVLVYAPRERYNTQIREAIGQLLAEAYKGRISAYYPSLPEGPLARVQFIIGRTEGATPEVAFSELEARITELIRTWADRLGDAIRENLPNGDELAAKYDHAFSAGYAETFEPARGVEDIKRIERLGPDRPIAIDFYRRTGSDLSRVRASMYRYSMPIPLSERVPVLENLGFSVIEERSWRVTPLVEGLHREVALHDMLFVSDDGAPVNLAMLDQRLEECVLAVLRGDADNDLFNRLVTVAGADWREATMLRAYGAYLRQLGVPFSQRYLAEALNRHAGMAREFIDLFRTRFDPYSALSADRRKTRSDEIVARIEGALNNVESADDDRILRLYLNVIGATTRTNYFQATSEGRPPDTIAFKLAGRQVEAAPAPKTFAEISVYSPRLEGIHLRFAPIARGGIRWSDRGQDFRTEVLGLCKAQQVKNAVIVPAGAKGGFVPKRIMRSMIREQIQQEGVATYRIFVSALLDITDNLVDGRVVPPPRVVRYDGDDPYLVVAADKGTATFSDIANELSDRHGFWLGDAFASGGSVGYDHKDIAITARGAWECVKRHFREMDHDIQNEPFRAVGVGDMSGDVFGNGALMSKQMRLVAAFDHRHIFLDPEPDPATSYAERARLFAMPRSSWADYSAGVISKGGGVFPRTAKTIALTPEVQRCLGIEATSLSPAELMQAILKAEVDLLWFGGIGTFIRASTEADADVGDRANDAQRITSNDLRVKVIGEGANLAVTQRARIEASLHGIRLNADFIDNSAGVNTSDQEVNIKIALAPAVKAGRLAAADRKALLAGMTDDVAMNSLRNNYQQSLALSLIERRAPSDIGFHAVLIRDLQARSVLDRRLEALPTDMQIAERQKAGRGLVRPELAILLSYAKIALLHDLLASSAPDDAAMVGFLTAYFPPAIRRTYAEDIAHHPLRREIIATALTNAIVNRLGPATPHRLAEETGRTVIDVAYASMAAREILGMPELWQRVDALDGKIGGQVQLAIYARIQNILIEKTAWFLRHGSASSDLTGTINRFKAGLAELAASDVIKTNVVGEFADANLPPDLAADLARLGHLAEGPAIVEIAAASGRPVAEAARIYFDIGARLHIDALVGKSRTIGVTDHYDRLAIASAQATLAAAHRKLTQDVLASANGSAPDVGSWSAAKGERMARVEAGLDDATNGGELGVARLVVAAAQLRELSGG